MYFPSGNFKGRNGGFVLFCSFQFEGVKAIGELLSHPLTLLGGLSDGYLWISPEPCITAFASDRAHVAQHPITTALGGRWMKCETSDAAMGNSLVSGFKVTGFGVSE
ncbi:hypothetical protein D3C72_1933840 [compost metagenome]